VIEIIQEYWKSLLWTDGYRFTGVAITLWLLISSVVMGGILAVFLAIGRVSNNKFIQFPIWLFTYVFRGTPLYVQLLVFYSGMYTLEIVKARDAECVLPQRSELYGAGVDAQYLRLYHRDFRGAIRSVPYGEIEAARVRFLVGETLPLHYSAVGAAYRAPAYSNEVILMLHSTALAFTATVPDLPKSRAILTPRPISRLPRLALRRCSI
jgi:histidine transport system permease protein